MANPNKIGLVIGALTSGWHLLWSLLVLVGWAQPILDFIFWAHMIKPIYFVKPFDALAAAVLIVLTAVIGYVFGFLGDHLESIASPLTSAQETPRFWQSMPSAAAQGRSC